MYNQKANKAKQRYRQAHLDRIAIEVPRGERDRYKAHAERIGKPLRRLIMDLIEEDIKRVDGETGSALVVPKSENETEPESR